MSRASRNWRAPANMTASFSTASSTASWRRPATCASATRTPTSYDPSRAGMGGSSKPDLKAEFNDANHARGACSMARAQNPNSANSQFFICFEDASFLNKQYTVWGQVIEGMDNVDKIKRGEPVQDPDSIVSMKVAADL
jgi:cyclophilin family peptidyl-prolyl cis-trans isomerase